MWYLVKHRNNFSFRGFENFSLSSTDVIATRFLIQCLPGVVLSCVNRSLVNLTIHKHFASRVVVIIILLLFLLVRINPDITTISFWRWIGSCLYLIFAYEKLSRLSFFPTETFWRIQHLPKVIANHTLKTVDVSGWELLWSARGG